MHVIKSEADFKTYRYIRLPNGLQVMLISSLRPGEAPEMDSDNDNAEFDQMEHITDDDDDNKGLRKSAAALCINVGSFADPLEAQGLAHFLEHMVFMGSEKYPRENDFDNFISHRGGANNACTNGDFTMFFFDIPCCYFGEALDKFANLFVAPLLRKDCVDRELEAVHSEFELAKANDTWRLGHLVTSLAKENSPYRIFANGSRISLRDMPAKAGVDVCKLLRTFQLAYYNASLMTVAIESQDTLDNLESMVCKIFGPIPNRKCIAPDFSQFVDPYPSTIYKKIYKVCPVKETVSISFIWSLPPMHSHYRSAALKFVASIVGHEGNGSLMAYLRKRNLAVELNAGCSVNDSTHHNQMTSLFGIDIVLSEFGRKAPLKVADCVFSYLRMLRSAADFSSANSSAAMTPWCDRSFASLIPEFEQLWASNFRFQEPLEPSSNVQTVAMAMRKFPPHEVFIADSLILERDLNAYVDLVRRLTPESVILVATLPEFNAEAIKDIRKETFLTEPWFDIRYAIEEISDEQMQRWQNAAPLTDFHLPEVNRFITNNFDLLPLVMDNNVPQELNLCDLQPWGQLWHQQRVKFNVPSANVIVQIYSDLPQEPKDAVILRLWSCALSQRLETQLYPAHEAGLSFCVSALDRGLEIGVSGFNEKLILLYQEIIDVLAQPIAPDNEECFLNRNNFAVFKDRLRQNTCNRMLDPRKLNIHIRKYLQQLNIHLLEDCMTALKDLTLNDVADFISHFFSRIYIKAFVYGNISAAVAKQYFNCTSTLGQTGIAVLRPYPKAAVPACINRLRLMNFNKADVNTCLVLMCPLQSTPSLDLRYEVMNEVIEACLQEPAFAYLRTKETLGYSVDLFGWSTPNTTGQCGISLCVNSQANKSNSNMVAGHIYAFWYRITPYIIFHLKEKVFKTLVEALIASNLLEDATMDVEISRNKAEVFSDRPIFDRRQRSVEILRQLKLRDLQNFYYETYYASEKQPALMIEVDSLGDASVSVCADWNSNMQKAYDWPLDVVSMSVAQVEAEQKAAFAVDLREAVLACAPNLINDVIKEDSNTDFSIEEERTEVAFPRIVEIKDVREFKHKILFAS